MTFTLARGEVLGVVGESGGGKTTLARVLARLLPPAAGSIELDGRDWLALRGAALRRERRRLQLVFQDPWSSLDPRQRVDRAIAEPALAHGVVGARDALGRVGELLTEVGLPAGVSTRYPHELSGGERQRVALARALAPGPDLLIADEPVSALDAPVKLQVVEILERLREERGLGLVIVAHELGLLERLADRIAVLSRGRLLEIGPASAVLRTPGHPYTEALAGGSLEPRGTETAGGEGCLHRTACPLAVDPCVSERPRPRAIGPGWTVACHARGELRTAPEAAPQVEPFPSGDVE